MPKIYVSLCFIATLFSSLAFSSELFPVKKHSFGIVKSATQLSQRPSYTFEVNNTTDKPVHLASVRTSCGCTTASIFDTKNNINSPAGGLWLQPGEKAGILAIFNTHTFIGKKGATLTVRVDSPYFAEYQLVVSGHIRNDLDVSPKEIQFHQVEMGESSEITVKISKLNNPSFRITQLRHNSKNTIETEWGKPQIIGQNIYYELHVRIKNNIPAQKIRDVIYLETNEPGTTLSIPVSANITTPVTAAEAIRIDARSGITKTVKVLVRAKKEFQIISAETRTGLLEIDFASPKPKKVHVVSVSYLSHSEENFEEEIRFNTDLQDEQVVVQVTVNVK